jgi:sugar lactone lactonase YvrE
MNHSITARFRLLILILLRFVQLTDSRGRSARLGAHAPRERRWTPSSIAPLRAIAQGTRAMARVVRPAWAQSGTREARARPGHNPSFLMLAVIVFSSVTVKAADTNFYSVTVGATPESVVAGFDGKLFVTLMGTQRNKGDGDGKIVVLDGDKVSDFAVGLDDPKGIVFAGGRLITADFDKVWAFDATGAKTLLAGPEAFPEPPRFLNDVALEPGGRSLLVTDMGDLAAMHASPGVFWPLDSEPAKNLRPLGRVYRLTLDGKVSVAIDRAPEMPNPNGVDALADGRILVADFFRGTLLEWKSGQWRQIADGHRSGDGIAHDNAGNLYLTEVRSGRVWHIKAATGEKKLLATLQSAADLILDEVKAQLIVPDSKAGLLVFIPLAGLKEGNP